MAYYRKRPLVIEARPFLGAQNGEVLAAWCGGRFAHADGGEPVIFVGTLEGTMTATPGMWIIKGVKGEFYPVQEAVFDATYEPAEPPDGVGHGAE